VRPPGWLPDPLDDALARYWDGRHWTFRTAVRRAAAPAPAQVRPTEQLSPPPVTPALRPDVARALERGILRKQFLQVNWNQAKAVIYTQSTKVFAVYTTKPTKRATPAMVVRVANLTDAQALAQAAQVASTAPRLDVI
jgi:hypothetical protein